MSFRRRITLVSAAAVAVAVVLASLLTYLLSSHQLRGQVDSQLSNREDALRFVAQSPSHRPRSSGSLVSLIKRQDAGQNPPRRAVVAPQGNRLSNVPPRPNQVRGYQQLVDPSGRILFRSAHITLPVDARTRAVAAGRAPHFFRDARVDGIHVRILTERLAPGHAVQVAQPLTEVDGLQSRLRLILGLLDAGGIALAALLGRLVAGAAVRPVKRLTQATEHVTRTQDLSGRIESAGDDEIGRLATSFNAMLDALERSMSALDASVHAQRQLVADASHELRTPVTSLRTNIEILQQAPEMQEGERKRLLSDVVEQIEELTLLMNDLIELARGEEPRSDAEDVRLDLVVGEVVERARRRSPATPFQVELESTIVVGVPARLERAVANLLDNAVKYSPSGRPIEICLHGEELTVRDHGKGISPEDLPYVFDRFYRGAEARRRPGSGLGLAIVRQVAVQQRGSVTAEPAPGGGALIRLRLPAAESLDPTGMTERPPTGSPDPLWTTGALAADSPTPSGTTERLLAKAGRRDTVASVEGAREVSRAAITDEPSDVPNGDRPLLDEQLRGR
ncbi:MAG TPA: HAMP domain-containing sensor histidine kinase [Solirubrobacteraceae bacterium]